MTYPMSMSSPSNFGIDLQRPLTRLSPGRHAAGIWVKAVYRDRGYDAALGDVWLRVHLVHELARAAVALLRSGYGLLVLDGWRPNDLQAHLYEEYRQGIGEASGLTGPAFDGLVSQFV